jgi:hypothetical protein
VNPYSSCKKFNIKKQKEKSGHDVPSTRKKAKKGEAALQLFISKVY